jgi:hypothetical protein
VEANLKTRPGQRLDLARAQSPARFSRVRMQFRRHGVTPVRRQLLDLLGYHVNAVWHATERPAEVDFWCGLQPRPARSGPVVDECLQILPPEAVGCVDRGSAQEEPGGDPHATQCRRDDLDVRQQIVVEGDRYWKAVSTAPPERSLEKPRRRHDAIYRTQVM